MKGYEAVAVSVIFYLKGDTDELLADYDRGWPLTPDLEAPGLIYHACLEMPDGIKVINHFTTEDVARTFLTRADVEDQLRGAVLADGRPAVVRLHAHCTGPDGRRE